jgi:mono/diheme cytochrome c family protein
VLGVKTRQLNGNFTYPSTGVTDNQLRTLNRLGLLHPAIDESAIANFAQMVAVTNQNATLVDRFRSYIDANCQQCHQPGGTGPTFDARYDTPLTNQNIINGVLTKGNLGYDNARVVAPDDLYRSVLYDRVNTLNTAIQMPPLARNLIDTNAVPVIAAWINSLPGTPALFPPVIDPAGGTYIGSVSVALQPPVAGATMYYTLDGSLPTTNSLIYNAPFTLSASATVDANAFLSGYNPSVAATAPFTVLPLVTLDSRGSFSNGMFQVLLSGVTGQSYVLQATTNFSDWISVSTNVPLTTPFYLADPGATNFRYRFYRALGP